MKKRNYLTSLLLAAALVTAMTAAGFAESKAFSGNVTYTGGSSMHADYDGRDVAASAADLEPGDDVTITITYTNDSDKDTDWYLRNDIIETLEETGDSAANGGYTYTLTDTGAGVIFSSDNVGGDTASGVPEGLRVVDPDGSGESEYISVGTLAAGESGITTLKISFDGETGVNDYQTAEASLDLQYAVEEHAVGTTETKVVNKTVKTGDTQHIIMYVLLNLLALLILILAILSRRKDRKRGGEDA